MGSINFSHIKVAGTSFTTLRYLLWGARMARAVVTALASHQCGPGSIPRLDRRHMWVEFVGSLLCTERFSPGTPVFPSPRKPAFDLICVDC